MNWAAPYVGIPDLAKGRTFAGCDCWGLAMIVFGRERGIELPDFATGYLDDRDSGDIDAIAQREKTSQRWKQVQNPEPFDFLLFRVGPKDSHVGLWCAPGRMLHVVKGDYAKIARYDESPWLSRLLGFYRWTGGQS